MPGIVWQEAQPYLRIAALPRSMSPPAVSAAELPTSSAHEAKARGAIAARSQTVRLMRLP